MENCAAASAWTADGPFHPDTICPTPSNPNAPTNCGRYRNDSVGRPTEALATLMSASSTQAAVDPSRLLRLETKRCRF